MHQEFIDELTEFATRNRLGFKFYLNKKSAIYYVIFHDLEKKWTYKREISQVLFDSINGSTVFVAYEIIKEMKRRIPTLI